MNYTEFAQKVRTKYPGAYDEVDDLTLAKKVVEKYPVYSQSVTFDEMPSREPGLAGKAWNALGWPERKSREGLGMMADAIPSTEPTGNLFRDVALNTPKVLGETVAEVAPGSVSREALLTAGALRGARAATPYAKLFGRGLAKTAESASGLEYKTPGVLTEAFKDPKLMWGQGTKRAGQLFDTLMEKGRIRQSFARATGAKELLDDAIKAVDEGTLTPEEALVARQTLDGIKKSLPKFAFRKMREMFDAVAKTKSAQADAAFSRAVKSEALRQPLPVNKYGGTSIFKSSLGGLAGVGPLAAMSPVVQGLAATYGGAASRALAPFALQAIRSGAMVGMANRIPKPLFKKLER